MSATSITRRSHRSGRRSRYSDCRFSWSFSATPHYDRASYIVNLMAFDRVMQRYPVLRFVLVMGPPVAHFARAGRWHFPPEVLAAYRRENLLIEIMFPITWGGVWDYPYVEAQELIRHMRELFGAAKLVWGSDMPNVERFCTYHSCRPRKRTPCSAATPRTCSDYIGASRR